MKQLSLLSLLLFLNAAYAFADDSQYSLTEVPINKASKKITIITSNYEEPLNITLAKNNVKAYYYEGGYQKALNQVGKAAMNCLLSYKDIEDKKLAIVFDIDETAVSNYQFEEDNDFSFNLSAFNEFISSDKETVMQPTLDLFNKAKEMKIATIFITERRESQKDVTEANLKRLGYDGWTKIIYKKDDAPMVGTRIQFKLPQREKLEKEGYDIIINIGDQASDLEGGYEDNAFKYPNPFYFTP